MRAVILAGGRGTRLAPYTAVLPKPLVPVGDRPILELVIRQLAAKGFTRIDLSLGHLGSLITTYLEAIELPEGLEIRYVWEDQPMGTAGAIRKIEGLDEPFVVMNGDVLTSLDFAQLLRFHQGQGAMLTVAVHRQVVDVDLGVIESEHGLVTEYTEKPKLKFDVSMGVYAYSPEAIPHIPEGRYDFPDLVKKLLAEGEKVATYTGGGLWFDIGTLGEYARAVEEFEKHPEHFDGV